MRTCRSILAIILAFSSVSCQSAPQSPVRPEAQPKTLPETQAPMRPPDVFASAHMPQQIHPRLGTPEKMTEVSVSISSKIPPPKKVSPIKPVIAPVESGLLSPPKPGSRYRGGCPCVE